MRSLRCNRCWLGMQGEIQANPKCDEDLVTMNWEDFLFVTQGNSRESTEGWKLQNGLLAIQRRTDDL